MEHDDFSHVDNGDDENSDEHEDEHFNSRIALFNDYYCKVLL